MGSIIKRATAAGACLILLFAAVFFTASAEGYKIGDVNNDGVVDAMDARLVLRHTAKLETLAGSALKAADVNGDGAADASDARIILRAVAGLEALPEREDETEPAAAPKTTEPSKTAPGSNSPARRPAPEKKPVPKTIPEIVAAYNETAKNTAGYEGKVKVTKAEGGEFKVTKIKPDILKPLIGNFDAGSWPGEPIVKKFDNGKCVEDENMTLGKFMSPQENEKMMELVPEGIVKASYVLNKDGSATITVKSKEEIVDDFLNDPDFQDQLKEMMGDLPEDIVMNGKMISPGAEIKAEVNKAGRFTKYALHIPVTFECVFNYEGIDISMEIAFSSSLRTECGFVY
ncbi:MAG: dockerin type I domain-containing protein [Oscillospiraceae bacterium]|nr:dockerin type I domain-containing protein [Oscillospiraceae bacterium]